MTRHVKTTALIEAAVDADRAGILEALDALESAAEALEATADGRWPVYTETRWRKLKRSLEILASDLRAEFGGWL